MYFWLLLNLFRTNFKKILREIKIIVSPKLKIFSLLTDNFIKKKQHTKFLWIPTTKISIKFGAKIVTIRKGEISRENLY